METAKCTFFFFFFFVRVKGARLMPSSAGSASLRGLDLAAGAGRRRWLGWAGLEELPWGGQQGEAPLAQPAAPANLETSLAMTQFRFIPPGKRFYGSSENANPQVSPFVTGSHGVTAECRVSGDMGQGCPRLCGGDVCCMDAAVHCLHLLALVCLKGEKGNCFRARICFLHPLRGAQGPAWV